MGSLIKWVPVKICCCVRPTPTPTTTTTHTYTHTHTHHHHHHHHHHQSHGARLTWKREYGGLQFVPSTRPHSIEAPYCSVLCTHLIINRMLTMKKRTVYGEPTRRLVCMAPQDYTAITITTTTTTTTRQYVGQVCLQQYCKNSNYHCSAARPTECAHV
jgi:hypothetical protein